MTTCVALVYIAWLYTGAAALRHECDNSTAVVFLKQLGFVSTVQYICINFIIC